MVGCGRFRGKDEVRLKKIHLRLPAHRRYFFTLGALFAVVWALLAVSPVDRAVWALENSLVVVFVIVMALAYRSFTLSRVSYTLVFVSLLLHEIGAHYTYAQVPYAAWLDRGLGVRIHTDRNHYDRLIHFCYGLFLAYPIREVFLRIANVRGFWGYFLPFDLTMSSSAAFEIVEWGVAGIFGGGVGADYVGSQGDPWDAQKDMALASLGALLTMTLTAAINIALQRDFAAEWAESLRVKTMRPPDDP